MKPRMNFYQAAPDTIKALTALEAQVQASGLEQSLIELVKTRASQINGCAFCINMTILGSRDGEPHHADRHHQRLEPARHQFPRGAAGAGQGGRRLICSH
jgi:alkylhydroperoxidase family enzyme